MPTFGPNDKNGYVRYYYPYAKTWEAKTGIPASVYLAIGASESNYGATGTLFGIKGPSPSGRSQTYQTWEMVNGQPVNTSDSFAVYDDANEAFQHFHDLISSGRYAPAWQQFQKTGNWQGLLQGINQAGYATDPSWWQKIGSLANTVNTLAQSNGAAAAAPAATPAAGSTPAAKPATTQGGAAVTSPTATPNQPPEIALKQLANVDAQLDAVRKQLSDPNLEDFMRTQLLPEYSRLQGEWTKLYALAYPKQAGAAAQRQDTWADTTNANANFMGSQASLQNAQTAREKMIIDLVHTLFGDDVAKERLVLDQLTLREQIRNNWMDNAIKSGALSLQAATAAVQTNLDQQASNLMRAGVILDRGKFIREGRLENAIRLLPPEQQHIPMFEPTGMLAKVAQNWGLPPMVLRANPVDASQFDPVRILNEAEKTAGVPAELKLSNAQQQAVYQQSVTDRATLGAGPEDLKIQGYDPAVGVRSPTAPTQQTYQDYLDKFLTSTNTGGFGAPPPPATEQTNANLPPAQAAPAGVPPENPNGALAGDGLSSAHADALAAQQSGAAAPGMIWMPRVMRDGSIVYEEVAATKNPDEMSEARSRAVASGDSANAGPLTGTPPAKPQPSRVSPLDVWRRLPRAPLPRLGF